MALPANRTAFLTPGTAVGLKSRVDVSKVNLKLRQLAEQNPFVLNDIMADQADALVDIAWKNSPNRTGTYRGNHEGKLTRRGSKANSQVVTAVVTNDTTYARFVEWDYHEQTGLIGCIVPSLRQFSGHFARNFAAQHAEWIESAGVSV